MHSHDTDTAGQDRKRTIKARLQYKLLLDHILKDADLFSPGYGMVQVRAGRSCSDPGRPNISFMPTPALAQLIIYFFLAWCPALSALQGTPEGLYQHEDGQEHTAKHKPELQPDSGDRGKTREGRFGKLGEVLQSVYTELPTEAKTSAAPWLPQTVHFTTNSRTAPAFTKLLR